VLPDIDILIPFVRHRGPIHSIIMALIIFVPVLIVYHKKAIPYLLALIQHSLVGDYMGGGPIQLLWPLSTQYFGIDTSSTGIIAAEWMTFVFSIMIMIKTRDAVALFHSHNSNLVLTIPAFTVLLPTFLSVPLKVPFWLLLPHLVYAFIFSVSIIAGISKSLKSFRVVKF